MEIALLVMQIVALGAVSLLCVYLITALIRLRSILEIVERDIKELSARAIPVLENLETITDKIKLITEGIDEQVELVKHSIHSIKEVADNVVEFERQIQAREEEPVFEAVGTIAAMFKGVRAFLARIRA